MFADARVGTSGFAYREWIGSVYPPGSAAADLLPMYAQRLGAVEIAATGARAPNRDILAAWAASVPAGFQFALKAPSRVAQDLGSGKNASRSLGPFLDALEPLGDALGPMLVQVPQAVKADRHALAAFLASLPEDLRVAFE